MQVLGQTDQLVLAAQVKFEVLVTTTATTVGKLQVHVVCSLHTGTIELIQLCSLLLFVDKQSEDLIGQLQ